MSEDGPGTDGVTTSRRPAPRRRHRRVDAPPTNPEADRSDDVPAAQPPDPAPAGPGPEDAREAWIQAQRPPHWD